MIVEKVIENREQIDMKFLGARLLDIDEVTTLLSKEERKYKCWWWLRSPGNYQGLAASVSRDGVVDEIGIDVNDDSDAVRPALVMSEDNSFEIGDVFYIGNYKFKVISNTLAWLYDNDIGRFCFDLYANDYEKSEIKDFIEEWFETEILK